MINLTDEQKEFALNMFNDDPNIINITKEVFKDDSLDGRSKEGRAVSKFLAKNGLQTQTTKRQKSDDVTLSEDQVEKILEMEGEGFNTSQIADVLFNKEVKRLSNEWRAVNDILGQDREAPADGP